MNNQIGPRFRIRDGDTFEVSLNIKYSNQTKPQITNRVIQFGQALSALGLNYIPSVTSAALQPVTDLQNGIAQAFSVTTPDVVKTNLSLSAGGDTAVNYVFRLDPTIDPDGRVFVGLRRYISVFPGDHKVKDGVVQFKFAENDPRVIRTYRLVHETQLKDSISKVMTDSNYSALKSTTPSDFQMACDSLYTALESSDFNFIASDRLAAQWAFAFNNPNIGNAAVRNTQCGSKFLSTANLNERGLPVAKVEVALPGPWQTSRDSAVTSATEAAKASIDATDKAVAATTQQIGATQTPRMPGTVILSFPGIGNYAGQAVGAQPKTLGVFTRTDTGSSGDTYKGEVVHTVNAVILSGYGVYTFGANPFASSLASTFGHGPLKRYAGQVNNSMFDGYGRLEWADNTVFEGLFSSDQPYRGTLTLPDGTMRYGTFLNGRLNGSGVEDTLTGTRWGNWTNGNLPVPNPPN